MAAPSEMYIADATKGFDALFSNDIDGAKAIFGAKPASPFHLLGLGSTIFLQACLGMESGVVAEAVKALNEAEAAARAQLKSSKSAKSLTRFPPGTEWEILHADAVVLQGLTNALSETYYGYMQSLYALNSAHSKFNKLHKTVFPRGVDAYRTPSTTPALSRASSMQAAPSATLVSQTPTAKTGLFGRLIFASAGPSTEVRTDAPPDGALEEMIVSGAAFGNGLFNLVLSLLPSKMRGLIGFLGFKADRPAALKQLAVAAAISTDPHAVFAGWQAEEAYILKQYLGIIERLESRYPKGTLWILSRAKLSLFTYKSQEAIKTLQDALAPGAASGFIQADALLVFELAWALLAEARYAEAAEAFLRMKQMNSWSRVTYLALASGCYILMGNLDEAQKLLDQIPSRFRRTKPGEGEIPTESYIKQKLVDWKEKHAKRGGKGRLVDVIKISPADELAIIWNNHHRMPKNITIIQIGKLTALSPLPKIPSPLQMELAAASDNGLVDLESPEELASRSLLLGILYRTIGEYKTSRLFFDDCLGRRARLSTSWIPSTAMFELATLDLLETESSTKPDTVPSTPGVSTPNSVATSTAESAAKELWRKTLNAATTKLDEAVSLSTNAPAMAGRIEARISMLRDEIVNKKAGLGL
ncbi:hypothetical protein M408DRAFT_20945 [Serendipita vermifera MAFF 305830]|uniref:Mitochondrial outer membrane protein IML2 n=1 Tax=Serendipita vermifera MAFF 305830 TaxID=933852 RepID=A0A0C3BHY7_SERVB|nr:hypothetical protein M408DRAFT_20945 [Serendipita vermifera MAFF 305830]